MEILVGDVIGDAALVLVASALLGAVARRCGQPAVVGQILAGIMLGPTVLGRLPGDPTNKLFPHSALPALTVLSQVAVVVFMFAVGYELDTRQLRGHGCAVVLVAIGALAVPFAMGFGGAVIARFRLAALGQSHPTHTLTLFLGIAMSITAMPVMAAIIRDRGLSGSIAAVTATAAASLMDVGAWLALALVLLGNAKGAGRPWLLTLALTCGFTLFMPLVVRPALRWWLDRPRRVLSSPLPVALALALASAWVTASLGIQPVFGGFLAGLTMPHLAGAPDAEVLKPMEDLAGLLLPLFFVITGLSVNISSIDGTALIALGLICLIATVGKLIPAYAAARLGGLRRQDAATVAALVDTRGLTELIALNAGLSSGIIGRQLFTIFVLMALATTALTSPLLALLRNRPPVTLPDKRRATAPSWQQRDT